MEKKYKMSKELIILKLGVTVFSVVTYSSDFVLARTHSISGQKSRVLKFTFLN